MAKRPREGADIESALNDLALEVLDILVTKDAMDACIPESDDLVANMRTLAALSSHYKSIVSSLCNVIDTHVGSNGGPAAIKRMRRHKRIPEGRIKKAESALAALQKQIGSLKTHRHERIAHIAAKRQHGAPHPPTLPAIKAAVEFVDALHGKRVEYGDASRNLREVVLGERP